MVDMPKPLAHADFAKKDDGVLRDEASAYLAKHAPLQIVAELLTKLRELAPPWWTPATLREVWSAEARMQWYAERADLRQQITSVLTGLGPNAARKKAPDFQAGLIDSAIDDGDIGVQTFEAAFDPCDLAVYGPAAEMWRTFRARMPWNEDSEPHQGLIGWLIRTLLADTASLGGLSRNRILTPWQVRTAIDGRVWHTKMPLAVRVAIDDARLEQEKTDAKTPFHASDDLIIALPELIASNVPLRDLRGVLDVAERVMGMSGAAGAAGATASEPPMAVADEDVDSIEEVSAPTPRKRTERPVAAGLAKRSTLTAIDDEWSEPKVTVSTPGQSKSRSAKR